MLLLECKLSPLNCCAPEFELLHRSVGVIDIVENSCKVTNFREEKV